MKLGHFGKQITVPWKDLKCGDGEGWRRSRAVTNPKYWHSSCREGMRTATNKRSNVHIPSH